MVKKKKPFVGQFNQKVAFYNNKPVSDNAGGTTPGKVLYWSTSAIVEPLRSSRVLQAAQTQLLDGFHFTIKDRSDKDIFPTTTILYRMGWLTIISAIPDYRYKDMLNIIAVWSRRPMRVVPVPPVNNFNWAGSTKWDGNYKWK